MEYFRRENIEKRDFLGLKKPTDQELWEERDVVMRTQYYDPIEHFPDRIDELFEVLNRVCLILYHFICTSLFFRFT